MIPVHPAFDQLLGGGLAPGILTHVYGPPASGKTNFALMAAASATESGRVIYIDPEIGFSTERIKQITGDKFNSVLEKIILIKPESFDDQAIKIHEVEALVAEGGVSLVVIDSIGVLYRVLKEKDIRDLGRTLAKLLHIALKHNVAVLMLNQVYTDIDSGEIKPVGGGVHDYWSKTTLKADVTEGGARTLTLERHPKKHPGGRVRYRITADGIEPLYYSR